MVHNRVLESVRDVIIDEACMWIITDQLNSLLRYNFRSKELELVAVFPEMMREEFSPFSKIVKLENEIYFIPRMAKDIFYYDISEKNFYALNIPFHSFQEEKKMEAVICGKYIYCINRFPDTVIKIDSVTKKTKIYAADMDAKTDKIIENKIYCTYRFLCLYHGKIIWPNYYNKLTIFDIESESFSMDVLEEFPCERIKNSQDLYGLKLDDWIVGVKAFDDMLWLCSHKDKVYLYDGKLKKIDHILFDRCMDSYNAADIKSGSYIMFLDMISLKDELWFISAYQNKCIVYHRKTKQFEEILDDYVKNWDGVRREYSIYKVWGDDKILLYSYFESCFYILDRKTNSVSRWEMEFPYVKFIKESTYLERLLIRDNVYDFDDLPYLFNKMKCGGEDKKEELSANINVGEKIYETINCYGG